MDNIAETNDSNNEELISDSREELENWLIENGLAKYSEAFFRNHITYAMLPSLNDEDFDNLEIHDASDINRFRKAVKALGNRKSSFNSDVKTTIDIPHSNSLTGYRDLLSPKRDRNPSVNADVPFPTFQPRHYDTTLERSSEMRGYHSHHNSSLSLHLDHHSYSSSVNEMISAYSRSINSISQISQEQDYNRTVSSQGDLNRYIAADSYVSDILPGAGSDNHPHEKKLLPRNWVDDVENYARAHPEDAEDIHMICDYLKKGLVILNEDSCHNSIDEILDDVIILYNKHKSVDTRINKKELLSNNNCLYQNGFLVIKSVSTDYQANDVLFARLHQRSVIMDHNNEQVKYIFIILGNQTQTIWASNLFSLLGKIVGDNTLYNDLFQARTKDDIIQSLENMAVRIQLPKKHKPKREKKKPIFSELKRDIKKRSKWYASDFSDGYTVNTILKSFLVFISQLSPALIFAVLINKYSHGNISIVETIIGQAITLIIWALFGGQPMILMGLTGPIALYVEVLYELAVRMNLPFFVLYEWVGIWTAVILMLLVAFNKAEIFSPVTEFTRLIFSSLTSVLFIMEVYKYIKKYYTYAKENEAGDPSLGYTWETFFFVCLVLISTVLIMNFFSSIRSTTFLYQRFRIFIRLASQLMAILIVNSVVHYLFPFVQYSRIDIPSFNSLRPSYEERPWFIRPIHYHPSLAINDWKYGVDSTNMTCPYSTTLLSSASSCTFPWWAILVAMVLAIPYSILVYLEDNITSGLIERPEHNLKKGGPYDYLDTTVTALLTFILSLFGLPWVSALYIRSIHHMQAISVIEDVYKPYGAFDERFISVNENRVSGIVLGVLFFCLFFFNSLLSYIPEAIYYGLLLYMGISLFVSRGLFKSLKLLFMDRSLYVNDVRNKLSLGRINLYTVIQVILLLGLILLKSSSSTAVLFPLGLLCLIYIRKYILPRIFTKQELSVLDPIVHHHND